MKETSRQAVLLVNLGSPDTPSVPDVRRYLNEFLMDGYVIDVPRAVRRLIVSGFILPFRPRRSAHAYQSIWWEEGSPLIVISERVRARLADRLEVPVALAMRYGNPAIRDALTDLKVKGCRRIFVVPLYPHYAESTIRSTVEAVHGAAVALGGGFDLEFIAPFYGDDRYIAALAESARPHLDRGFDHLLVSYHGLPERHLRKADPTRGHCLTGPDCCSTASTAHATCYRHQVFHTTRRLAEALDISEDRYSVSFQSRLGADAWLKPATVDEVRRLAAGGKRRLAVLCPAFVSDCLETLEEISIGVREQFLAAGGESFNLIPCLNDHPMWIDALAHYCARAIGESPSRAGNEAEVGS